MAFSCASRLVKPADRPRERCHYGEGCTSPWKQKQRQLLVPDLCWLQRCTFSGFDTVVCVRLRAALQPRRGKRRQMRPFTDVATDAARATKTQACSSEHIYFATAVFGFKTFTFVLITLIAHRQLWRHGISSLGLPSHFS